MASLIADLLRIILPCFQGVFGSPHWFDCAAKAAMPIWRRRPERPVLQERPGVSALTHTFP